jgi:hypothetical protein
MDEVEWCTIENDQVYRLSQELFQHVTKLQPQTIKGWGRLLRIQDRYIDVTCAMGLPARHAAVYIHTDDATVSAVEKRLELLEHSTVNRGSTHR